MTDPKEIRKFVRHVKRVGDPTEAWTLDTPPIKVTKEEYIFWWNPHTYKHETARCLDYGDHFIYSDPKYDKDKVDGKGRWFAMCTCGSPAIIINPDVQERVLKITDPKNILVVCYIHTLTAEAYGLDHGKHMTGGTRWI